MSQFAGDGDAHHVLAPRGAQHGGARLQGRRGGEDVVDEAEGVVAREAEGNVATDEEVNPRGIPSVVRIKRFDMEPMFEEDAIARMEELDHAFFVFLNAESDRICVLYARRDGTYGLIEPVVGGRR